MTAETMQTLILIRILDPGRVIRVIEKLNKLTHFRNFA